jgi:hypothetical protein
MIPRLADLIRRRARLITEIDRERDSMHGICAVIRQDLAYAGFGLMAGRLMARHPWLRNATLAFLTIVAASRLAKKSKTTKINEQ